jgi:hypothetical protein
LIKKLLAPLFVVLTPLTAFAYSPSTFYAGLGFYSQNALQRTTISDDGKASIYGTRSLPLVFKYDIQLSSDLYFSPEFTTSYLYPRWTGDGGQKVTLTHLAFPVGAAIGSSGWDWSAGLGILNIEIKGSGGTKQLNNGGSTATFAIPGRTVTTRTVTLNGGLAYNEAGRWGLDLIIEGALSSNKRSQSFMFSYLYKFGGR